MVLDKFGSGLKQAFKKIVGLGVVDKEAVEAVVKELQRALLQADVDVKMVSELSNNIREKAARGGRSISSRRSMMRSSGSWVPRRGASS